MFSLKSGVVMAVAAVSAACASLTPTYKSEEGFVIYDIRENGSNKIARENLVREVTDVLKKHSSSVRITRGIPPSTLPEAPGRFEVVDAFKGTGLAALARVSGASLKVVNCDGALMSATTESSSQSQYGEKHNFSVCLYQYKAGYSLNVFVSSVEASGGFSPEVLGATIAKSITGGSAQFIPRTINELKTVISKHGTVNEVDKYMPESYEGIFYDKKV